MKTILCIDDEPTQLMLLRLALVRAGYRVLEASNGQKGMELAIEHKLALIITDLMMPVMDGGTAIWHLKQNEITKHIPILVLSAYTKRNPIADRAMDLGAEELISKSLILTDLMDKVKSYLAGEVIHEKNLLRSEIEIAQKMELAYQLEVWKNNPELASTLEQLTRLTGGIIHDLRNRLGILRNYSSRANYCLRLLDSLAFLRFKPSLSRQMHKGTLAETKILTKHLTEFGLEKVKIGGFLDSEMLLQRLWLLVQGMTGRFSRPRQNRVIRAIEIEDKRFLDPQSSFYITIATRPKSNVILPKKISFTDVLLGDEVALCLFLLQKAVFLNNGTLAIDETGEVEIKVPISPPIEDSSLETLQSSIATLTEEISTLSKQYHGPEPNIYSLIKGFVAAISRELDNIAAKANSETNGISNEKSRRIILRNCRYAQLLLQNLVWLGVGIELPKEPVNLGDTLLSVREIMRGEIRERTDDDDEDDDDLIEVKLELEPDLPPVSANQVSLQQVFMNLITNALEAMPESGILTLRAFQTNSEVHAEVCDTGDGIPPENIERIFDLAFSTKEGQERGTGLHIVKSIVDKLGGRIEVTSKPGVGTTFRVCLQNC